MVACAALMFDLALGEPDWLYARIPHPVILIGRAIGRGEAWLRRDGDRPALALMKGAVLVVVVVASAATIGYLLSDVLARLPLGWVLEGLIASSLLAWRSLYEHVARVAQGLAQGLDQGRTAVRHIVGRDPMGLDRSGVARAAIESAAENVSDGVIAPVFWLVLLGLPGLLAYKAINTLDSMIGYRSSRYLYFGRCAARFDDIANWLPARLSALLIVFAAAWRRQAEACAAWRVALRDARTHASPNAGWPEAATAGALSIKLGGPRRYGNRVVEAVFIGDGRSELQPADITAALRLINTSCAILLVALAGATLAWQLG